MAIAKKLPKLLSEGLVLALKDLAWIEANPKYQVNMGTWHTPLFNYNYDARGNEKKELETCEVCFAGSVMAKTLKVDKNREVNLSQFSDTLRGKLVALDSIREGDIQQAILGWYGDVKGEKILEALRANPLIKFDDVYDTIADIEVVPYDDDADQWRADMNRIAAGLAQLGI